MKRLFHVRTSAGRQIAVVQAMDRQELAFAVGPEGEVDRRYALEWVIDQLSRDEHARSEERSPVSGIVAQR